MENGIIESGRVVFYEGFSNNYIERQAAGTVESAIKAIRADIDIDKCICVIAGRRVDKKHTVKAGEVVFVREAAGVTGCMIALAVIGVVGAVAALGMSIYSGIMMRQAQEEAEKASKAAKAMSEQVKQLPFLKGAKNRVALGYNIPYIMGRMYDVPYKITSGCYRISGAAGEVQEWLCSFVVGYNALDIESIKAGTAAINGSIEVLQAGDYTNPALTALNTKITATSYGDEIPHKYEDVTDWVKGVTKQLEQNTYAIDVCIMFNGLRHFNKNGYWEWAACAVRVDYSNDGGVTWVSAAHFDIMDFRGMTLRYVRQVIFPSYVCYGKDISIRLVRETPQWESNGQDTCYLAFINCYQYDAAKSSIDNIVPCMPLELPWRDRVVRIGVCIESNDSTRDTLDEVNCIATGRARVYESNRRAWSADKRATRNSAAWVLEILTSSCHTASALQDSEIDLEAFGALYDMCEAEGFHCDGIVTEDTKKDELISEILMECGATMFIGADGKWTVSFEGRQNTPVALLNEESITSITASKDFSRKPFALKATYTNRDVWANDTRYMAVDGSGAVITGAERVMAARGGDKSKVITEAAFKYITDWGHLYKIMRRMIAKQRLQVREISVNVGQEGDFYPLYSTVLLQTKQLKTGLSSGVIRSTTQWGGRVKAIKTGGLCEFLDNRIVYGLIVQHERRHIYLQVESKDGAERTRDITIIGGCNVNDIAAGDIYSFGELDADGGFSTITSTMQITGVKQSGSGWELSLRDYSDTLYEGGANIPVYKSNITIPRTKGTVIKTPTYGDMTSALIEAAKNIKVAAADETGKEAAEVVTHGVHFTSVHKIPDMEASLEDVIRMVDEARAETMDGISVTKDMILLQITDAERELRGALAVQAGAVTALVEGGGSVGQMQLSLELPVLINNDTRNAMIEKCGEDKVNAVYALLVDDKGAPRLFDGNPRYAMQGNVSSNAVKELWDEAVKNGMLASSITLDAEQILLNGEHTWLTGETHAKKISAKAIDVEALTSRLLKLHRGGLLCSEHWDGSFNEDTGVIENIGTQGIAIDTAGNAVFKGKTTIGSGLTVEDGVTRLSNTFVNGTSLDDSVLTFYDNSIKWARGLIMQWGEVTVNVAVSTVGEGDYRASGRTVDNYGIATVAVVYSPSFTSSPCLLLSQGEYKYIENNTVKESGTSRALVLNANSTGFTASAGIDFDTKEVDIGGLAGGASARVTFKHVVNKGENTYRWLAIGF